MNAILRRGLAVLLAGLMGLSALVACGETHTDPDQEKEQEEEVSVILESENYQISLEEFKVYQYQTGMSKLAVQYWYYAYGLMQDKDHILETYLSPESYAHDKILETIKDQPYRKDAYSTAEQYIVYCEGAHAAGMDQKLSAEVNTAVNEYISNLKDLAKSKDLSLKAYIQKYMGESVTEDDVRSAMKKANLATIYGEIKTAEFSDALTTQELADYADNNPELFFKTYYQSYKFNDSALAEPLSKATSPSTMLMALTEYVLDQTYQQAYETHITGRGIEDPYGADSTHDMVYETLLSLVGILNPETGEVYMQHFAGNSADAYSQAAYNIVQEIYTPLNQELGKISSELAVSYIDFSDSSDGSNAAVTASPLYKWLLEDDRRAGDVNVIQNGSNSYEWVIATKVMVLDETLTRNVCYVNVFSEDAYTAEEKAYAFLFAFSDNKSVEKFNELAESLNVMTLSTSALHEYVSEASLSHVSYDLSAWLFDSSRIPGDTTVIPNGNACYVAYYVSENQANWIRQAREGLSTDQMDDWYEETKASVNIKSYVDPSQWESTDDSYISIGGEKFPISIGGIQLFPTP